MILLITKQWKWEFDQVIVALGRVADSQGFGLGTLNTDETTPKGTIQS